MGHKNKKIILPLLLIAFLGIIAYANSINGQFVYDDKGLVRDNVYIRNPSYVSRFFTEDIFAGAGSKSSFFRPLQMISYMINHSFSGMSVRSYHITNITLHVLVSFCVWWLLSLIFRNGLIPLFSSLLFVVHPVHTEVVSYIAGRADSLSTLFMLLSLIFYVKHVYSRKALFLWLMPLFFTFSLLSKESALVLPLFILLCHYALPQPSVEKRLGKGIFLPVLGIMGVYILYRQIFLKALFENIPVDSTFFQRIPGFFVAMANYIRLLIFPFGLHMDYEVPLFAFSHPKASVGAFLIFCLLAVCAVSLMRKNKVAFFSVAWFFAAILPVSNLYPVNAYMAEHWLYFPSIGFFVLLTSGALAFRPWLGKHFGPVLKKAPLVLLISMTCFYLVLTIRQNRHWQTPSAFWEHTSKYSLRNPRVYSNLGIIYAEQARYEKAVLFFKKAIEADPQFEEAYSNLGNIYQVMGKQKEAESLYLKAIEIDPNYARAYNNLATHYHSTGRNDRAIPLYERAIKINPVYADAYYNLGVTYQDEGNKEKALPLYKQAIRLNPGHAMAHNNLAVLYYEKGNLNSAKQYCKHAMNLGYNVNPEFLEKLGMGKQ